MTHEQFIAALNLYVDGALPPPDAANLEREIAGSPERRRIYRQYCQMQNACAELAERFREEAAPAPFFRRGAVVDLPARRAAGEWVRSLVLVASGALAACVVFVVARQGGTPTAAPTIANNTAMPVAVTGAQPVTYPTTAGLTGAPAGFRNPWASQHATVVDFAQMTPAKQPLLLKAPVLETDPEKTTLQPYGQAPGAPLRMEEINAAAFQFQR